MKLEKNKGSKFDQGKPRYDLLPVRALEEVAKVYTFGVQKYDAHNWRKGITFSRLFSAMMRHALAWWRGETYDKEHHCHHLSSVVFCALCLMTFELEDSRKDLDDRFETTRKKTKKKKK